MGKRYVVFDPDQGFPKGENLFYECMSCHIEIPSIPKENLCCKCFNVFYDVDEGKFTVQDTSQIALFQKD